MDCDTIIVIIIIICIYHNLLYCIRYCTPKSSVGIVPERGMPSNTAEAQAQIFYESCRTQNEDPQDDMNAKALEDMIQVCDSGGGGDR